MLRLALFASILLSVAASPTNHPGYAVADERVKSSFCNPNGNYCHLGAHDARGPGMYDLAIYDKNCLKIGYLNSMKYNDNLPYAFDSQLPSVLVLRVLGTDHDSGQTNQIQFCINADCERTDGQSGSTVNKSSRLACWNQDPGSVLGAASASQDWCWDIPFECNGFEAQGGVSAPGGNLPG